MAPLTFTDTYNMVAFLSKSDAIKKVNDDVQLRALIDGKKVVVSEAIIRRDLHLDDADGCLSAKRTAWNEFRCFMASAVIFLGRKVNFSKYIFDSMVRNVDSPSNFLMYQCFLQVVLDHQVDDMTTHNTRYTSPALTQKVFANMKRVGKGFSGVETPQFASMLVQPQPQAEEEVEVPISPAPPSITRGCIQTEGKIEAIDADEEITLVDVETNEEGVAMDDESHKRLNQEDVNTASKGTLIKLKAEKAKLLDEQIAQRLHDEEVQKAAARDKQEKADMERALELQRQYDDKEENIDWSAIAEQNMLEIVSVPEFKVEVLQVKYPIVDWEIHTEGFDREDLVALWNLVKEKFSSAVPSEDKEEALWVELKRVHHVSSTKGHDIFMLTEKDYPLANAVMILMLSGKLQVEEDNEMAIDLAMKIDIC
nr:hypothetical protein [Tanacetum cinerariifolium]